MRHKNSVKQLGKTSEHRSAMFNNMVTSFFNEERIVTTKQKGRVLRRFAERLITRAKHNLELPETEVGRILHNKREVMKVIKNRDVVRKLFEEIAPRFKDRKGGYTRQYLIGQRMGDAAEMSIVELVVKAEKTAKAADTKDKKEKKEKKVKEKKEKPEKKEKAK